MGRPRIHQTGAERTAAWRQRQRLATIGITEPDPDLAVENARLRGELERLVLDLAAARADITRLTDRLAAQAPTRPPAPRSASAPASRPLPPPTPPEAPLPPPSVGPSEPALNRAQRRQAEREQRRHTS